MNAVSSIRHMDYLGKTDLLDKFNIVITFLLQMTVVWWSILGQHFGAFIVYVAWYV